MCKVMEEMCNETVRERNVEIAESMLASKKLSYEDIALFSGLTIDEVKSLDASNSYISSYTLLPVIDIRQIV